MMETRGMADEGWMPCQVIGDEDCIWWCVAVSNTSTYHSATVRSCWVLQFIVDIGSRSVVD